MKNYRITAALVVFLALALEGAPLHAQTTMSAPIVVKQASRTSSKVKGNWLKEQVIHADGHSMMVSEQTNGMMIHTFTYSPQLQDKMQRVANEGGYQYGDKVKILYQPGGTVALKLR